MKQAKATAFMQNEHPRMKAQLRISADFNSGSATEGDPCWCLRYKGQLLDEVSDILQLVPGLKVILYYEDPEEEFEVDAVLKKQQGVPKWVAVADWQTFRRLR